MKAAAGSSPAGPEPGTQQQADRGSPPATEPGCSSPQGQAAGLGGERQRAGKPLRWDTSAVRLQRGPAEGSSCVAPRVLGIGVAHSGLILCSCGLGEAEAFSVVTS